LICSSSYRERQVPSGRKVKVRYGLKKVIVGKLSTANGKLFLFLLIFLMASLHFWKHSLYPPERNLQHLLFLHHVINSRRWSRTHSN